MENEITAHKAGVIAELPISEGAAVTRRRHPGRDQGAGVGPRSCGARYVLGVDLPHRAVPPRERQRGVRAALEQRLQVRAILAQDRQRALGVQHRAVPGTTCAARSTSGSSRSSVAR